MEKVQNLKSSNTAPSSKTFRDELLQDCLTTLTSVDPVNHKFMPLVEKPKGSLV
jgi:hypothetical protein